MTEQHERAMVAMLLAFQSITSRVGNRVLWDSEELDVILPSVTLRLLGSQMSARELTARGGVRRCLIEVSSHASTSTGTAQLCDAVTDALESRESGPFAIMVQGGEARFGALYLDDVTQSFGSREGAYRKAARFIVTIYE